MISGSFSVNLGAPKFVNQLAPDLLKQLLLLQDVFTYPIDINLQTTSGSLIKMPKEKNYNPVQAQRKADKAREVKKGARRRGLKQLHNTALTLGKQARREPRIDGMKN